MRDDLEKVGQIVQGDNKTPSFIEADVLLQTGISARPGELLQVELISDKHYLVGRVEEGREINPYETPENARIRELVQLESIANREDLPRKFRVVRIDLLEELVYEENGTARLREPQTVPPAGSPVYRVDAASVSLSMGISTSIDGGPGLSIGSTLGGVSIPLILNPNAVLPRHVLIVGTTGTGKSWLKGVLMEEISGLKIPQVLLDIHGESIKATSELKGTTLIPGQDLTVRLSSLSEPELLGLLPLQNPIHIDLVTRSFVELKKRNRPFGIAQLVHEVQRIGPSLNLQKSTIPLVTARIESLEQLDILGDGIDWMKYLMPGSIINLDCRKLGHFQMQAVAGAVARELLNLRLEGRIPPVVIGIDEAHLFLPYGGGSTSSGVLSEVIRFGRHYGICLILATPSPTDIDRKIIRTTNTRFIFALEPDQLNALEGVFADAPKDLIKRLPKLEQGVCLLTGSRETIRHAVLLKVRGRKTTHGGETPDIVKEAQEFQQPSNESIIPLPEREEQTIKKEETEQINDKEIDQQQSLLDF